MNPQHPVEAAGVVAHRDEAAAAPEAQSAQHREAAATAAEHPSVVAGARRPSDAGVAPR